MRKYPIIAAVLALATPAFAADQLDAGTSTYDWSGIYVGANLGWAGPDYDYSNIGALAGDSGDLSGSGIAYGAFVGANFQYDRFVFGVEADWQGFDADKDGLAPLSGHGVSSDLQWLSTVRGRFGIAFDNILPYVTAGVAFGKNKVTETPLAPPPTWTDSNTHTGYAIGAGAEVGLTQSLILRLEYLYTDLGSETYQLQVPTSVSVDSHTVRAGLSFKF